MTPTPDQCTQSKSLQAINSCRISQIQITYVANWELGDTANSTGMASPLSETLKSLAGLLAELESCLVAIETAFYHASNPIFPELGNPVGFSWTVHVRSILRYK